MVILILLAFKLGSRSGEQQRSSSSSSIKLESSSITSHEKKGREREIVVPSPARISRKLDEPFSDFQQTQTIGISIANVACKKKKDPHPFRPAPLRPWWSTGGSFSCCSSLCGRYITLLGPQIRTARRRIDTRKSMEGKPVCPGPGMARCESRTEPLQISWGTGGVVSTDTESFRRSSCVFTPSDRGVNLGSLLSDLDRAATTGFLLLLLTSSCVWLLVHWDSHCGRVSQLGCAPDCRLGKRSAVPIPRHLQSATHTP